MTMSSYSNPRANDRLHGKVLTPFTYAYIYIYIYTHTHTHTHIYTILIVKYI